MSATTVFGQVRSDQASTHSKRNAVIVFTVIALFAVSFFVGRATATSHVSSSAQVASHPQLSPADRAIVANDVAPLTNAGPNMKLSPANRGIIDTDVAPLTNPGNTEQISPANRAMIANDVAPVTPQLSQANSVSCVAGRPC
jgi:hypothetical protein